MPDFEQLFESLRAEYNRLQRAHEEMQTALDNARAGISPDQKDSTAGRPDGPRNVRVQVVAGKAEVTWDVSTHGDSYEVRWRSKAKVEQTITLPKPPVHFVIPPTWEAWVSVRVIRMDCFSAWSEETHFDMPANAEAVVHAEETSVTIPGNAVTIQPGDDVQKKIDATPIGQAIVFQPGRYALTKPLTMRGGHQYFGKGQPVIEWKGAMEFMAYLQSDVVIQGMVFDGAGLNVEAGRNIQLLDNIFQNVLHVDPHKGCAIRFGGSIMNARVQRNLFQNLHHLGVWADSPADLKILDNRFLKVSEAIHTYNHGSSYDVLIGYNLIDEYRTHGMECQNWGRTERFKVIGNWVQRPSGSQSNMALSIALGDSPQQPATGIEVLNNVLIADGAIEAKIAAGVPPHWFTGIEIMGDFRVEGNFLDGWTWNILYGWNRKTAIAQNNTILGRKYLPLPGKGDANGQEYVPEKMGIDFQMGTNTLGAAGKWSGTYPVMGKDAGPRSIK